jgi:DNA-binding NarL/FixJ family response regulator
MNNFITKIVIVSSNTFVRLGLRRTFDTHPSVVVVGECPWVTSSQVTRDLIEKERPDLIVVDVELDMKMDAISILRKSAPLARIVLLTGWADMEHGKHAMEIGDVIMMKCQPASILLAVVKNVTKHPGSSASDETPSNGTTVPMVPMPSPKADLLTKRERAVIALVGEGLSNRDIAERLYVSEITVRHHLTSIFSKLGVSNRLKLLILAHQYGLTDLHPSTGSAPNRPG